MDTVLNDLQIEDPSAVVPPVDADMADILPDPTANSGAMSDRKKEKKLSKEEKKAMKEQKKKAKKEEVGEDVIKVNGTKRTIDEVEDAASGVSEKKKKREKHKHGKE